MLAVWNYCILVLKKKILPCQILCKTYVGAVATPFCNTSNLYQHTPQSPVNDHCMANVPTASMSNGSMQPNKEKYLMKTCARGHMT